MCFTTMANIANNTVLLSLRSVSGDVFHSSDWVRRISLFLHVTYVAVLGSTHLNKKTRLPILSTGFIQRKTFTNQSSYRFLGLSSFF